jgi:hypothetical protein
MEEQKEILKEIKALKTLIAQLMGSANPAALHLHCCVLRPMQDLKSDEVNACNRN